MGWPLARQPRPRLAPKQVPQRPALVVSSSLNLRTDTLLLHRHSLRTPVAHTLAVMSLTYTASSTAVSLGVVGLCTLTPRHASDPTDKGPRSAVHRRWGSIQCTSSSCHSTWQPPSDVVTGRTIPRVSIATCLGVAWDRTVHWALSSRCCLVRLLLHA